MLAEYKRLQDPHDVLLIFRVILLELLEDASLDEALLVQALLVAEDLQSHDLLLLVVETFKDLAEGALADSLLHFEAIRDMVVYIANIFAFVIVEAAIFGAVRRCQWFSTIFPLQNIEVVNLVVLKNLRLFIVKQVFTKMHDYIARLHRELDLEGPLLVITEEALTCDGRVGLNTSR